MLRRWRDPGREYLKQLADGLVECGVGVLANQVKLAPRRVVLETALTKASDDVVYGNGPEQRHDLSLFALARVLSDDCGLTCGCRARHTADLKRPRGIVSAPMLTHQRNGPSALCDPANALESRNGFARLRMRTRSARIVSG